MGKPIQYRNADNPSQIQGWVSHNKGGFCKTAFIVMVPPPGVRGGGLMKTFQRPHPSVHGPILRPPAPGPHCTGPGTSHALTRHAQTCSQ